MTTSPYSLHTLFTIRTDLVAVDPERNRLVALTSASPATRDNNYDLFLPTLYFLDHLTQGILG